jgi:hypothetical protein
LCDRSKREMKTEIEMYFPAMLLLPPSLLMAREERRVVVGGGNFQPSILVACACVCNRLVKCCVRSEI